MHERYRALLRDCEADGVRTSLTELLHALLLEGPTDVSDVRALLRRYRHASDDL
jgi:hypothetical protein